MRWRWVPPVYSPLSAAALWRGFRAMTSRRVYEEALAEIDDWIRRTYDPAAWLWTDSGTSALTLALRLAALETGSRRVALPAYGCYDLATACDGAESEVVLYDLDPATLGPDWESLDRAVGAGARAVVAAHLYGMPVEMTRLRALARARDLVLIEDAAQAIGATVDGRPCGSLGELSVLSFGRGKGVTAGAGGALLSFGERWRRHDRRLDDRQGPGGRGGAALAKAAVQWALGRPSLYRVPASIPFLGLGETIYHSPHPARAATRSAAGVLSGTVPMAPAELERRRSIARRLLAAIGKSGSLTPVQAPINTAPGYLRLPLVARDARTRRACTTPAARLLGVMPGYPGPLAALPGFGDRVATPRERLPGAELLVERLFTLPTHGQLGEGDVMRLEAWLRAAPTPDTGSA